MQMVKVYGLRKVVVKSAKEDEETGVPVFMSQEFKKPTKQNKDLIGLVLIQGTGAVKAGIWARSVCVNNDFEIGTMLPQIEWA